MRSLRKALTVAVAAATTSLLVLPQVALAQSAPTVLRPAAVSPATGVGEADQTIVPSAVPGSTPNVSGGAVLAIAKVGSRIILGGNFSGAANTGGGASITQPYLLAFDAVTGRLDTGFRPTITGEVRTLQAAADGTSVYVGGVFTDASGPGRNLARLDASTGARTPGFAVPALNGAVNDLDLVGGRLFVGGVFTTAGGSAHGGLAAINSATGAVDHGYLSFGVTTNHNWPRGSSKAPVGVTDMAPSPDGTRMAVIGNFRTAGGQTRDQVFTVLLGSTSAVVDPNWRTTGYEAACAYNAYDSYVRDVDYSPDGRYFVVAGTGGGYAGTLCDTAARFESTAVGQAVQPTWVAATGCDTLLSVAITTAAVYVGGHSKWMNAPNTGCSGQAQQAQVPRPGLAALDPLSGLPLTWNPGRHPRGTGASVLYTTSDGLYVGSDTDYVGPRKYKRAKVAYFPLAGGAAPVVQPDRSLPARMIQLNGIAGSTAMISRTFTGTAVSSATTTTIPGGVSFASTVGGFMVADKFVYGSTSQRALFYRTFDGTNFGPETRIDPYNDPVWSNVKAGDGSLTYRGALPDFYNQVPSVTSMTYTQGRIYYTLYNNSGLYWRWFSPDSGIVGASQFQVAGVPSVVNARGMFYSGGALYRGSATGNDIYRLTFVGGVPSGEWESVAGTSCCGPYRAGSIFLGP